MKRTPRQIDAVRTMTKRLCVDAGAGSGKTSVLIDRVIHVIEQGLATLDGIVAITFTDAAAAEMKMRLRKAFRGRAPVDDPEEMSRWRDMERRVETARISTIHSFCSSLLRENALRIGLDPDFTVMAEGETTLLREETATDAVHTLLDAGDAAALRAATEFGARRLIAVLEGLLGKRAVVNRLRVEHPLNNPEALELHWRSLIDATRRQRVMELTRSATVRDFRDRLAAFDGKCRDVADKREVIRRGMIAALDRIMEATAPELIDDSLREVAEIQFQNWGKKNWDSETTASEVQEVLKAFRDFAAGECAASLDESTERQSAQTTSDVFSVFEHVSAAYRDVKAARTSLDFDDLIETALAVLRDNPEVRARTARGVKFLLIDEFQDTDSTQLEIARLLADHPEGPDLFIVGDAKQSIYDFRGAEVEVFQAEKSGADLVIPLAVNFRTVPEILRFVNETFVRSSMLKAVEPEYSPLEADRGPAGEIRVEFLIPDVQEGALIDAYREAEADLIAWRLGAMCRGAEPVFVADPGTGDARRAEFGDVAVLFRSMTNLYLYEKHLREREIPYNVVAGAGFYERQEIIDLRNLLTVLVDPWDEMALLGFLRGPMAGLSDESLVRLCAGPGLAQGFYSQRIPKDLDQPERLAAARDLVAALCAHSETPLPAFLRRLLDLTGYEAIVLSQFLGPQKARNVRKIIDLADDFARTRLPKLAAFVHYLDQVTGQDQIREGDAPSSSESSGAVTLMTIHKAKGLEFPIVVVPDAARGRRGPEAREVVVHRTLGMAACVTGADGEKARPGIYAAIQSAHDEKDRAEHARILYVAMTRARDWLLIGGAPRREKGKGSWIETLDALYGLLDRPDGDPLSGNGWSAIIRREAAAHARPVTEPQEITGAYEGIELRAAPVAARTPGRTTFSVSELLDAITGAADPEDVDRPHGGHPPDALVRGTVVHHLFEVWDFREEPPIHDLLPRACPAAALRETLEPYLQAAARRFRESAIGRQMIPDVGIRREMPFLLRVGDALVGGKLDALLSDRTVVDYKTGAYVPDRHARYELQLQLYAVAVRRLTRRAPPAALVYYVETGEHRAVDVSEDRLDEALSRVETAISQLRSAPLRDLAP